MILSIIISLGFYMLVIFLFLKIQKLKKRLPKKIRGKVFPVDGDGFLMGSRSIRLWGIDAPELPQKCGHQINCGKKSKEYLQSITQGNILCYPLKYDPYKRLICRCYNEKGKDLSYEMVKAGWAIDLPDFSHGTFQKIQKIAQKNKLGIWRNKSLFAIPSEWRKERNKLNSYLT